MKCVSDKGSAPCAAAAVVAVVVPAREVGRGHEWVALVRAAVLQQHIHTFLTVGLARIGQCCVAVGITRHDVYPVLEGHRKTKS